MVVGLVCYKQELGGSLSYVKALYALKKIYDCRLILFGNPLTKNLFKHCDWIDVSLDLGNLDRLDIKAQYERLDLINAYKCDYLIATTTSEAHVKFLLASNARRIVCATKLYSLLSPRCLTVPIYTFKKYHSMSSENIMLSFARRISPRRFDRGVASLDFSACALEAGEAARDRIRDFLSRAWPSYPYRRKDKTKPPCLVLVNPFNVNNPFSLSLPYWIKLASEVARLPGCRPVIVSFPAVRAILQEGLEAVGGMGEILVFENDEEILNLVALVEEVSCVISPSTGTIHLASNLGVPTIGLYAKWDLGRWGTRDGRYVFIPDVRDRLDDRTQEGLVLESLEALKGVLGVDSKIFS